MGKKRVLVGYGIDVDAVSGYLNTTVGGKPNLTNVSRGAHMCSQAAAIAITETSHEQVSLEPPGA